MATQPINPITDLVLAEVDSEGYIPHAWLSGPGIDETNGVLKTAQRNTARTLLDGADGATLTGVGVLSKLVITNGSGSAITVQVYDNTSATGTKLTPTLCIPTLTTLQMELDVPYALGVYIDFSTPTTCTAIGYSKAVV